MLVALDPLLLAANARAWSAHAGVPLRAVIKSEGYGWGFASLVHSLEDSADAFIVADTAEFYHVRALTRRPILTLGDTPAEHVPLLLAEGGIPNIVSLEALDAAARWAREGGRTARVRVALSPAVGWFGFSREELHASASAFARAGVEIELWTHVLRDRQAGEQRALLVEIREVFRAAGARVVALDVESTVPLSTREHSVDGDAFVRVGIGLFGARYATGPSEVRCALRLEAPVVRRMPSVGQPVGYAGTPAPQGGYLAVLRCGYGDGLPRMTGTELDILAVGMQYTTIWRRNPIDTECVTLLDAETDLDAFARSAGVTPHEIVVRLGAAARSKGVEK